MSGDEWEAGIKVTDDLVKTCLQTQFPTLMPLESLKCIGEGWDNKVYLVNDTIVFRFPRREIAVQLIERENVILKALQSIQSVEIPNPVYLGKASPLYPYPFHGYPMLHGESGEHAHLTEQKRSASILIIADFLKQLHGFDAAKALQMGAKPPVFNRTSAPEATEMLAKRVGKIVSSGIYEVNMSVFEAEMQIARDIKLPGGKQCLIHGDLYCRHLLFNQGRLTGIIDWGDVAINNPSVDLGVIWSFYPQSTHSTFLDIYGSVDPDTWHYARFLGIFSALTVLLYGSDMKDVLLVEEAINSVNRINPALLVAG